MEMEMMRVVRGQKEAKNTLGSDDLEIITLSEETQNENNEDFGKKLENFDNDIGISPFFLFDEDRRYKKEDLKYNFLALKGASWLKVSPFGVDENSKNFPRFRSSHKKWWGNLISFGWLFFASIRTFIILLSTVHFGMTENPDENLGQMTLMITLTINDCILLLALTSVRFSTVQNLAPFLFSIFKYLDAETEAEAENELQEKKTRPRKFGLGLGFKSHTLKELLIIQLPFAIYSLAGMAPLLVAFDPSFPLLLVSMVPAEISFSFLSLAAVDSILFLYYYMIIHMLFYIFMGMHRIQEEAQLTLKNLKLKIKTSSETTTTTMTQENEKGKILKIQKALKSLGLLHIWTRFFNRSFSNTVYFVKLICLAASISGGFGFIKMIEVENVPYAGIFCLFFFEGIILYIVAFGRAFEIPEKVEDLKREIRHQSFKTYKYNSLERKYVEKYLRSIPWLGVKDGVYKMERMTCVNYIDFAVQQITDLVLAY